MEEEYTKSLFKGKEVIVIRYVNPTMSNDLLCKYPDYSAFGFDYSQSGIWSPLVPRFQSLSCLSTKSPELKRKISFDDDGDGECGGVGGCNVLGKNQFLGFKKKVCGIGSKLNDNLKMKKKFLKSDCGNNSKSRVSDFSTSSPTPSKKGWKKALKMTSKQFKKKRDHHQIHHNPKSRITLADYLQCQNF
ncbi:hypothetical protein RND81_02G146200 [Saponaria officinalis]|uniref:Uncharacterized protein n=1 Tax=Saponaria officinalis TaxID=3572 RepID=A0AAW1MM55_SAPOF